MPSKLFSSLSKSNQAVLPSIMEKAIVFYCSLVILHSRIDSPIAMSPSFVPDPCSKDMIPLHTEIQHAAKYTGEGGSRRAEGVKGGCTLSHVTSQLWDVQKRIVEYIQSTVLRIQEAEMPTCMLITAPVHYHTTLQAGTGLIQTGS